MVPLILGNHSYLSLNPPFLCSEEPEEDEESEAEELRQLLLHAEMVSWTRTEDI